MTAALAVFWISLAVCVYVYFGYPALLWLVARFRTRPVREADVFPSATFVIAAFNEEGNIARKIENTLSLDYPPDRIEVLVVSNGSTDRTESIVTSWNDPRVRLIALPRPGKMEALNEGARSARGDILVFTDADFFLDAHSLREMADFLKDEGVEVKYAIHPVAGRMPGHMNVLLAEADIPYPDLVEMAEINPEMPHADVALVVGANDVVNPAARSDKGSPIYGMPIIDADKARTVFAIKRSKNPGVAGIDNELYFSERTWMLFGDAKNVVGELVKQLAGAAGGH